jgi:large subunit ribosomal protein L44
VFVVGIYSGGDKLGEGFGTSLKMAEYRAAEEALHRLYLTQQPLHLMKVPSSTFGPQHTDLFDPDLLFAPTSTFVGPPLGHSEVLLHSSGRSGSLPELDDDVDESRM